MRVCYVVIGFHPSKGEQEGRQEERQEKRQESCAVKPVDIAIPGNVMVCGVAQDMATARSIASEQEHLYGTGNVVIFNSELKPPKSTDLPHPGFNVPSWMK